VECVGGREYHGYFGAWGKLVTTQTTNGPGFRACISVPVVGGGEAWGGAWVGDGKVLPYWSRTPASTDTAHRYGTLAPFRCHAASAARRVSPSWARATLGRGDTGYPPPKYSHTRTWALRWPTSPANAQGAQWAGAHECCPCGCVCMCVHAAGLAVERRSAPQCVHAHAVERWASSAAPPPPPPATFSGPCAMQPVPTVPRRCKEGVNASNTSSGTALSKSANT
jgi:hypothetical protein